MQIQSAQHPHGDFKISFHIKHSWAVLRNAQNMQGENNTRIFVLPITVGLSILLLLVCVVSCFFLVFSDLITPQSPVEFASSALRIDIPKDTTVIVDNNDGPSFPLGDGYSWMVLQIPTEKAIEFTNSLKKSPIWKPLPLPKELAEAEHYLQPTFEFGLEGTIPITTSTGYYFFIDSQEEYNKRNAKQTYDTTEPFYKRPSFNFTFGLFDDQDGKLYLWSIDT